MIRISWLIVLSFLFFKTTYSQIPGLTQLTTDNGLPSNTIYDITQDDLGYILYATDYGLSKFDGISFKNYTISDGLPGNEILYFYTDSKKRIWMVSFNGKVGYIQNGHFYNSNNTPFIENLNSSSFINNIFEDSKGQIWFFHNLKNIMVLQNNLEVKKFALKSDIILNYSSIFIENKNKQIYIFSSIKKEDKILLITKPITSVSANWEIFDASQFSKNTIERINENIGLVLRENDTIINKIYNHLHYKENNFLSKTYKIEDKYWVTNLNEGVCIFDESDGFSNPNTILKSIKTTRSFVDNEHNIWIGSQSNGVFLFPNIHINGIQFDTNKKNDLQAVTVFNNKIVVGNELGELITLNQENLKTEKTFTLNNTTERTRHLKIYKGELYVLSDQNIQKIDSSFKLTRIKNMYEDQYQKTYLRNFKDFSFFNDNIYTSNSNGIAKINIKSLNTTRLWTQRSSSLLYEKNDSIWIGTTIGLYLQIKKETKKININEQFDNSIIYALKKSKYGLLIGSNSYGLGILKNNIFKSISTNDGLLSNLIKSIFIDTNNNIWLSTNFGLNCLTLNNKNEIIAIKSYTTSDGLYSNDVRNCYVDSLKNKVYIATSKGLNIIDLSKEDNIISAPITNITEILLNNSPIEKIQNQQFNYNNNDIQFSFSGISFKSLGNITFKYRLKGLENEWIETKNNSIRYSSLPPKNYTFELIAISKNKLESAPILFSFIIKQPIYKTWWFITFWLITLIAIAVLVLNRRNSILKQKRKTAEQISNLRYQALNAQMNPHFINNLLVNINSLAEKGKIKDVKYSLQKFSELVNLILQSTKSNLINISDEIEMAKLYLELQKLRFNKNINFAIDTKQLSQDDLESILVPPMILQPIIENSFKHGFNNGDRTNKINVTFHIENDEYLICEISDNGIGIKENQNTETQPSGISFSNINERLQLINDSNNLEKLVIISNITDEFNTLVGLKVTLKIPLISF